MHRSRRIGPALSLGLALLFAAPPAGAGSTAQLAGVSFERRIQVQGTQLRLRSLGLLSRFFIKGYVAALYLEGDPEEGVANRDPLADVPKRLEIHYFRNVKGSEFGKAALAILERQNDPEALAAMRPRIDEISALYSDVAPGDRYAITYLPGRGTELSFNGEPLGTVPGSDFASAYFGIWLAEESIDGSLREQLLGNS